MAVRLADRLALLPGAHREDFFAVSYTFGSNMDNIAELIVARVDRHWPSDSPDETIEVDVVGISMGGLMGRYTAMPAGGFVGESKFEILRDLGVDAPEIPQFELLRNEASPAQRERLAKAYADSPFADRIAEWLREADDLLGGEEIKRMSAD